jgi:glyoxylase-like metal-dependent hydrolase (beta-lactamase superfamily II)
LKLSDDVLAQQAGVAKEVLAAVKAGEANEEALRALAGPLGLGAPRLLALARKAYVPQSRSLPGLAQFNTAYEDMTVNSYLAWRPGQPEAVAFDTGADAGSMLAFATAQGLQIRLILLTHIHPDHIADLARLKSATGAPARVSAIEPTPGADPFVLPQSFSAGGLQVEARQTSGHAAGGITYVVTGLAHPVAIVGDALFAGSMGGGMVSFPEALATNRKQIFTLPDDTVIGAGHGPLTTVGEEKQHNPFYPEFR